MAEKENINVNNSENSDYTKNESVVENGTVNDKKTGTDTVNVDSENISETGKKNITEEKQQQAIDNDVANIINEIRKQSVIVDTEVVQEKAEDEMVDITALTSTTVFPKVTKEPQSTDTKEVSEKVETDISTKDTKAVVSSSKSMVTEKPKKEKKKKDNLFAKILCGLVASIVVVGGVFVCIYSFNPDVIPVSAKVDVPGGTVEAPEEEIVFLKGIQIEGYDVSGKTIDEAKSLLALKGTTLLPDINLTVEYEGSSYSYKRDDFDFTYDINSAVDKAYEYNQKVLESESNDILANAPNDSSVKVDNDKGTVSFNIDYKVTQASVQKVIKRVAKKVDIPCVEPHVSKFDTSQSKNSKRYTFKEGSDGKAIDQDKLIAAAMDEFNKGSTSVSLTAESYESKPTLKMSDVKNATKLIGKFSTVTTNTYNANQNMATALKAINGKILEPGDTLSFNDCTGNSNLESNGYLPAGVISRGEMTTGVGGGICQAATTLYNAAIMANMEIVEREPHLWCSYYVYGGLDATIDWGNIDLKIKNNSKYQMFFRCWMDGVELNVEIYGWQSSEFDEVRTETELDWSSSESYGYNSYRVFYKNGKKVKTEELPYSVYSLSNGGGIRGADPGNVSTKLKQPE
ncbi:MAG: VanW family protein [Acutalibacteraceae bacterium]|nr:VanW family protein [Acutalibacteraceae bacterium]